jgi:transcriptional regulator GlxA family with amidase domain
VTSMTHRGTGGLAAWKIQRLQTFMEVHLNHAVSVDDLAFIARVSRSHLSRGFRISFGESPHSYLLRLRIERSLVLLKDTDLSLCRVATECGFSDQSHFNRVFKQRLGGTPGTWRRAHRNPFATGYEGLIQGLDDSGIAPSGAENRGAIPPDGRTCSTPRLSSWPPSGRAP